MDTLDAAPRLDAAAPTRDASLHDAAPDASPAVQPDAQAPDASIEDVAPGLRGLTLVAPCADNTPLPLAKGATCAHAGAQKLMQVVELAGDPAHVYELRLRIRGIWEPTSITGGTRPDDKLPLTLGGKVAQGAGDPINYQQWYVRVDKPAQTYWLNDYRYVAHDIHREDYEATVRANGGSTLTIVMNDGNDHQIANWTRDVFSELDGGAPSTGQMLRIDVVSVK
ncbi:MAG TPA: hypothetical protein VI299_11390 [Polyangiales bacterium]